MIRILWLLSALLGLIGVVCGALGSHYLKTVAGPAVAESYRTALLFHFFHLLAALAVLVLLTPSRLPSTKPTLLACLSCWLGGILFFSGTIFVKALFGLPLPGFLTQIGGVSFMLGWLALAWFAFQLPVENGSK